MLSPGCSFPILGFSFSWWRILGIHLWKVPWERRPWNGGSGNIPNPEGLEFPAPCPLFLLGMGAIRVFPDVLAPGMGWMRPIPDFLLDFATGAGRILGMLNFGMGTKSWNKMLENPVFLEVRSAGAPQLNLIPLRNIRICSVDHGIG